MYKTNIVLPGGNRRRDKSGDWDLHIHYYIITYKKKLMTDNSEIIGQLKGLLEDY